MEDDQSVDSFTVRTFGVVLGIATHILFFPTVYFLFEFLHNGRPVASPHWLFVDALLALQFAVLHSAILHPAVKSRLTRRIKPEWYGLFFCLTTCGCLALMFVFWRGSQRVLWQATGWPRSMIEVGFYGSWVSLVYSLSLSGLGYQTGLTPWLYWLRRKSAPRRELVTRSLYRWLRHPAYLSFMGLIWFTPRMSFDHVLLTVLWTTYIFVASYLKDERVAFYAGERYRKYQAQVPGYPFILWGALAKRRTSVVEVVPISGATLHLLPSHVASLPEAATSSTKGA